MRAVGTCLLLLGAVVLPGAAASAQGNTWRENDRLYQGIAVITVHGAKCTFVRSGRKIGTVRLKPTQRIGKIRVDVTRNHDDIAVTCTHRGYRPLTRVIRYEPVELIFSGPGGGAAGVWKGREYPSRVNVVPEKIGTGERN
jgi:hypothetical protein